MTGVRARSTSAATRMPVSGQMPGLEHGFGSSAAAVAHDARPVLRTNAAILLGMTADTRDPAAALSPGLWDAQCRYTAIRPLPAKHALEIAARRVLAELIRRWPANALPPAIGIFTDGSGVAFSSDHPSPLSPDWLARHQAGCCPTTILHPFGHGAAWPLLIAQPDGTRSH